MAESEARGLRRQMAGKLREFEGQLLKLEGELLILRSKADRVAGEAQTKLSEVLAEAEREAEGLRRAGQTALDSLGRAVEKGQTTLERVRAPLCGLRGRRGEVCRSGTSRHISRTDERETQEEEGEA